MNYIFFQLVVLHAALTLGFGPVGGRRGFGGTAAGFGNKGSGSGDKANAFSGGFGPGQPPASLFPSCAVSYLQFFCETRHTDDM
jgi:hypothetical protein